jgi:hypothetical protein
MRQKIDKQAYQTVDEFAADFHLIIKNCMTYNSKETVFYRAAVRLHKYVSAKEYVLCDMSSI